MAALAILREGDGLSSAAGPVRQVGDGAELDRHVGDGEPPHLDEGVRGGGGKGQRGGGDGLEDAFHAGNSIGTEVLPQAKRLYQLHTRKRLHSP